MDIYLDSLHPAALGAHPHVDVQAIVQNEDVSLFERAAITFHLQIPPCYWRNRPYD